MAYGVGLPEHHQTKVAVHDLGFHTYLRLILSVFPYITSLVVHFFFGSNKMVYQDSQPEKKIYACRNVEVTRLRRLSVPYFA